MSIYMSRIFLLRSGLTGVALALLLAGTATAQTHRAASTKPKQHRVPAPVIPTAPRAAMGPVQHVQRSLKHTISLTTESLAEIERRRQATTEARWDLNEYAYVRILSQSVISAPGFQPLEPVMPATR